VAPDGVDLTPGGLPVAGHRRLLRAAAEAVPSPSTIVFGSALWGIAMSVTAMIGIALRHGMAVVNPLAISGVYFYGGSLAFAPTLWLCRLLLARRGPAVGGVLATILILFSTHVATAAIFALQYRVYYAHWHANFPSPMWFIQLAFTSAGAVFTFTVSSLTYYWPLSCLAFLAFGLWFALRGRAVAH
jgi:hypothetical protein